MRSFRFPKEFQQTKRTKKKMKPYRNRGKLSFKLKKSFPPPCTEEMNFQECELAILRQATDEIETTSKREIANSDDVKNMISIVEQFLCDTKCICYGGTAINNILPEHDQFYNKDVEVPDYDFYSKTPVEHAKQLANIYHEKGYTDVEAKSGMHYGTYKVFVNFIPMADITYLHDEIFDNLSKEAIKINNIFYAPPNFLRMGMYLELSRPSGDVSRWEKVLKRLTLLNKYYPLKSNKCHEVDFQRTTNTHTEDKLSNLYYLIRDSFIEQGCVFFGGYASSLYSKYMPAHQKQIVKIIPDFDVLHENPELAASIIVNLLKEHDFKKVKLVKHDAIGEVIPLHFEIVVGKESLAHIYKPIACHNYNEIFMDERKIRVATIDTILSFYLAFLYSNQSANKTKYKDRLLCMSTFLFEVEQKNRLAQKGVLKRFSIQCYGTQETLETIRTEKSEMFKKLRKNRTNAEWERWFLKYSPYSKPEDIKEHDEKSSTAKPVNVDPRPRSTKKKKKKDGSKRQFKRKSDFLF